MKSLEEPCYPHPNSSIRNTLTALTQSGLLFTTYFFEKPPKTFFITPIIIKTFITYKVPCILSTNYASIYSVLYSLSSSWARANSSGEDVQLSGDRKPTCRKENITEIKTNNGYIIGCRLYRDPGGVI